MMNTSEHKIESFTIEQNRLNQIIYINGVLSNL